MKDKAGGEEGGKGLGLVYYELGQAISGKGTGGHHRKTSELSPEQGDQLSRSPRPQLALCTL